MHASTITSALGLVNTGQIGWEQFLLLEQVFADRMYPKLTYLRGELEIMSPSLEHERSKSTLALLVEFYMRQQHLRFYKSGALLLKKEGYSAGEPDESYCIGSDKAIPDLVLEIIVSSGSINKLEIYKPHKIPEVWFWKKGNFQLFALVENDYVLIEKSRLLPELDFALLKHCLTMPDQFDAVSFFAQRLTDCG